MENPQPITIGDYCKCGICTAVFSDDIIQCINGHSHCRTCVVDKNAPSCPKCGVSFNLGKIPNKNLEKVLDEFTFQCPHKQQGCTAFFSRQALPEHVTNCHFSCNWVRVCGYLKVPGCTERLDVTTGSQITGHLQTHGFNIRGYQANPDFIGWGTVNFPSGITYDPSARHRILDAAVFLPEEEEENVIFCTNCFAYNESEHDRFIAITSVILKPPSRFPEGFSHQYVAEYRLAQCRINSQHSRIPEDDFTRRVPITTLEKFKDNGTEIYTLVLEPHVLRRNLIATGSPNGCIDVRIIAVKPIEAAGAGPEPVQPEIIDLTGDDD